ncbi:glucose/arabinose dehydrogenase [Endobacter medicaginis]|uniref:Glucose/arabinose dehydrogenase n=1 Tax=Endobacter medicaginis TaxID=1181271 RepID=A0A839UUU9_9PROT|nr:PQQ-dependent sugar dehydrogenase [Endobacter medicaginis]MBB3173546.1 glucose/arabinose dehydrogenase [Endobacter medicaginis]MCX5475365.1 PQQ-dependent sugar dehydrogenase [Endobacter medicaginis]NVN31476.1 PQQ-dependent sugar dehydrogenase [Endobacter medicaginis]
MLRRLIVSLLAMTCLPALARPLPSVPARFHLDVVTDQVPDAREIALGPPGVIFVGSMDEGAVYAVRWRPGQTAKVTTLARDLADPAGVAFHGGDLYVSATNRILVLRDIIDHLDDPPKPEIAVDHLPWKRGDHYWKFIAFGPDGLLYVPIGAPCNVCAVGHDYGKLMRMRPDGSAREDIAYGIRNSVGIAWPTGATAPLPLYFTDNGRDGMGDDLPSDELNRLDRVGQDFGFPFCHQGDTPDPDFGAGHPCADFTPPLARPGAHVATLGLRFYDGPMFPAALRGSVIIAEHGSWDRSTPSGYRVVAIPLRDGHPGRQTVLLEALSGLTPLARPADVQPLPDGSLLISDQLDGRLFRLTYEAP